MFQNERRVSRNGGSSMPEGKQYERTVLITGATSGIGRQTAADLAAHPHNKVILHGVSDDKCQATRDQIIKETGNRENIDYVAADFSSLKEVNQMAEEVARRFPSLNILLCNASVLNTRRGETKDGYEITFQVNYLSHFLLCNKLIPTMEKNRGARIYMMGSVLHNLTSLDWTDLMATKDYEKYLQFSRTKLMCHMMAFTLHRRMVLSHCPVVVNVIELGKEREPNNNGKMRTTSALSTSMSTLSICRTAGNIIQLIENPSHDTLSGKYLDPNGKQLRSGSEATEERAQEKLWRESAELCQGFI